MSGWSFKSLGERVASGLERGLQDLETSIQQQANARQSPNKRPEPLPANARPPTRVVTPRSSLDTTRAAAGAASDGAPRSTSDLANSAIVNLRASLRKGRADGANGSSDTRPPSPSSTSSPHLRSDAGPDASSSATGDPDALPPPPDPPHPPLPPDDDSLYRVPSIGSRDLAAACPLPPSPELKPSEGEGLNGDDPLGALNPASPAIPSPAQANSRATAAATAAGHSTAPSSVESASAVATGSGGTSTPRKTSYARDSPAPEARPGPQNRSADAKDRSAWAEGALKLANEELAKAQDRARAEEDKRAKSISLLKAVRQKLAQVEKEKDAFEREAKAAAEGVHRERVRFEADLTNLRASQEQQITKLRNSFDRETNSIRAQYEREAVARKGQYELDAITAKASYQKELAARDAKISQLTAAAQATAAEKDRLFQQLQARQAQVETSSVQADEARGRAGELEHELANTRDRVSALQGELETLRASGLQRRAEGSLLGERSLAEAESRHQASESALRSRITQIERERSEVEAQLGRTLQERLKEVERLRQEVARKDSEYAESVQSMQARDAKIREQETKVEAAATRIKALDRAAERHQEQFARLQDDLESARERAHSHSLTISDLQTRLEDAQKKEANMRSSAKSLKDELRKVQSGVLLSESQRNPGVGYFASFAASGSGGTPPPGPPRLDTSEAGAADALAQPRPSTGSTAEGRGKDDDAEVNFEYLRNTLLQFLEHKEMRPHLVRVLAVILHFTPQETRRLAAKVAA